MTDGPSLAVLVLESGPGLPPAGGIDEHEARSVARLRAILCDVDAVVEGDAAAATRLADVFQTANTGVAA